METKTTNILKEIWKFCGWQVLQTVSLLSLLIFTIDGLDSNWTWNPAWDLLIARIQGPFFTDSHGSSILAICFAGWFMVISALRYKKAHPLKYGIIVFATVGLHEFPLFFWDVVLKNNGGCTCLPDQLWYAGFILVGLGAATWYERKFMLALTFYFIFWMFIYVAFFHDSDLQSFANGPSFIYDSFVETFGWITGGLAWLVWGNDVKRVTPETVSMQDYVRNNPDHIGDSP